MVLDKSHDQFKPQLAPLKMTIIWQPPKEIVRFEWQSTWNLLSAQEILAIKDKVVRELES